MLDKKLKDIVCSIIANMPEKMPEIVIRILTPIITYLIKILSDYLRSIKINEKFKILLLKQKLYFKNELQKNKNSKIVNYTDIDTSYQTTLNALLKKIEKYENIFGKPFLDMDDNEIKYVLSELNLRNSTTRSYVQHILRDYTLKNRNKKITLYSNDIYDFKFIYRRMLKNPNQLRSILHTVYDSGKDNQPNRKCRDKLIIWLLYNGMTIEEIITLHKKDIDYSRMTVKSKLYNHTYTLNDEICELWSYCANMDSIEKNNYNYELIDSAILFRPIKSKNTNETLNVNVIIHIVYSLFSKYSDVVSHSFNISPNSIRLSGIFYNMYLKEMKGEDIMKYFKNSYFHRYKKENLFKLKNNLYDYNNWKQAFC